MDPNRPPAPRPSSFAHGFPVLLGLARAAFGPSAGEAWLVTDHPVWRCMPLRHARTPEGFRDVEAALFALLADAAGPP